MQYGLLKARLARGLWLSALATVMCLLAVCSGTGEPSPHTWRPCSMMCVCWADGQWFQASSTAYQSSRIHAICKVASDLKACIKLRSCT